MDKRLLQRTVELAQNLGGFDPKKLPKSLRIAVDSRPLEGAGRVEDTFNLLAHAARDLLQSAAGCLNVTAQELASRVGAELLVASSIKKALDIPWESSAAKELALRRLLEQIESLETWVRDELEEESHQPPLAAQLETLSKLREQDLEPDPSGAGARIERGTAKNRRVSISDPEMRHGRKSARKPSMDTRVISRSISTHD